MEETTSSGWDWNRALETIGKTYVASESSKAQIELQNMRPYVYPENRATYGATSAGLKPALLIGAAVLLVVLMMKA